MSILKTLLPVRAIAWLGIAATMCFASLPISAEDILDSKLRRPKLDPTPAGVEDYLRSLIPNEEMEVRIERLLSDLGHPNFKRRQAAMSALQSLPVPPIQELENAAESRDPEVRARVRRILARATEQGYKSRLIAALTFVERRQVKGLASVVIQLMPQMTEPHLFRSAQRALHATVETEDAELLRREIADAPLFQKEAAVLALGAALGQKAAPELLPLLQHQEPSLQLAAAEALADLGHRESLAILIELLESPQILHRHRSVTVLRAVTGQRFSFSPSGTAKNRVAAVAAWRNWHREHGQSAKLTFPFPRKPAELGRTVVCVWASRVFKEVTETKADVFSVSGFRYVWGCHALPDGRRWAVDAEQHAVFQYDENGTETWRRTNLPGRPTSVEGLENGNVLIACSDSERVVEIASDGRIVWDFRIEGRPTTAQRMPSGHTVINLQNAGKVVEVDQQGNVTELLKGLHRTHTAQQLDNGNILVTEMRLNRVDEYDLNGNIVWSKQGLKNPAQAQRLSNGHTLIADEEGLHEFDVENNRVWHLNVTRSRFYRY